MRKMKIGYRTRCEQDVMSLIIQMMLKRCQIDIKMLNSIRNGAFHKKFLWIWDSGVQLMFLQSECTFSIIWKCLFVYEVEKSSHEKWGPDLRNTATPYEIKEKFLIKIVIVRNGLLILNKNVYEQISEEP